MMKSIFTVLLIAIIPVLASSQTKVSKTYPVKDGQKIALKFDYPQLVHISTWDKKEISIEASVNINGGENNGAFTLNEINDAGTISISNQIDMSQINDAYYVLADGLKTRFNSKADFENYKKTNNLSSTTYYQQRDIQVSIEIKVPANVSTDVASTYGIVTLDNFNGPVKVDAKFGGIDASLNENRIGHLKLTNRFGKIYTDLLLKPTEQIEKNFYTSITASPGTGPSYDINSSYGNIYLRKSSK